MVVLTCAAPAADLSIALTRQQAATVFLGASANTTILVNSDSSPLAHLAACVVHTAA